MVRNIKTQERTTTIQGRQHKECFVSTSSPAEPKVFSFLFFLLSIQNTYKKNLILGPRSLHRSAKNRRKEGKGIARVETVYSLAVAPQAIVQALGFSSLKMVVSLLASVAMR